MQLAANSSSTVNKLNRGWSTVLICLSRYRTSTRRQQSDLFGLRVKLSPVTTSLTTQW